MTYTHRNTRTGKRCRIASESKHDGYTVYGVEVEGEQGRTLWPRQQFWMFHQEIPGAKPAPPAVALLLALVLFLPWVGGKPVLASATGCGQDGWPKCGQL